MFLTNSTPLMRIRNLSLIRSIQYRSQHRTIMNSSGDSNTKLYLYLTGFTPHSNRSGVESLIKTIWTSDRNIFDEDQLPLSSSYIPMKDHRFFFRGDWLIPFHTAQQLNSFHKLFRLNKSKDTFPAKTYSMHYPNPKVLDAALNRIKVKVAAPSFTGGVLTKAEWETRHEGKSEWPITEIELDAKTLRLRAFPLEYGFEELSYIFRDFDLGPTPSMGKIVEPSHNLDKNPLLALSNLYVVRFASEDEAYRAFVTMHNSTLGKGTLNLCQYP